MCQELLAKRQQTKKSPGTSLPQSPYRAKLVCRRLRRDRVPVQIRPPRPVLQSRRTDSFLFRLYGGSSSRTLRAGRTHCPSTGNSVRLGPEPPEASPGPAFRRGNGSRRQLERTHLRLLSRQHYRTGLRGHGGATARVRSRRQVHPRDRPQPVCVVVRAHRARRQGRQHLGRGQRVGHGHQVQPRRPGGDGVRPQKGSVG